MLFLSRYANFSIKLRSAKPIYTPKGDLMATEPRIKCHFQYGVAPQWAIDNAIAEGFVPPGKSPEAQLGPYFSVYDTKAAQELEGWDDETREWVEQQLLTKPGRIGSDYVVLEVPSAPKPWPAYDKAKNAAAIVKTMTEIGVEPAVVLAYERENQARLEVLNAVEAAVPEPEPAEELISA